MFYIVSYLYYALPFSRIADRYIATIAIVCFELFNFDYIPIKYMVLR